MTRVFFNVNIIDDRILESSEKFQLTIISGSLPNRVRTMPNNSNEVTVTIVDDDCKLHNIYVAYRILGIICERKLS